MTHKLLLLFSEIQEFRYPSQQQEWRCEECFEGGPIGRIQGGRCSWTNDAALLLIFGSISQHVLHIA